VDRGLAHASPSLLSAALATFHVAPPAPTNPPPSPPPRSVVVVLSEAFVSKHYTMVELELLLRWQEAGSSAVLLPVLYDLSYDDVLSKMRHNQAQGDETQARQQLWQRWAETLGKLDHITDFRKAEVCPGWWC
jgi:hypothetical protein